MSDGSDIDYTGNEFGSNFESSSVSISSESDLDERHVVVLVKLFATSIELVFATGERCVNMDSKSVRRLKLSRFPWFLGWAWFQSTCHSGLSRNLWSKLGPGMWMCRITVTGFCPAEMCCVTRVNWLTTPKTGNEIHNSRQPPSGQPNIWGSSLACSWTCGWGKLTLAGWSWSGTNPTWFGVTHLANSCRRREACQDTWFVDFPNYQFHFRSACVNISLLLLEH